VNQRVQWADADAGDADVLFFFFVHGVRYTELSPARRFYTESCRLSNVFVYRFIIGPCLGFCCFGWGSSSFVACGVVDFTMQFLFACTSMRFWNRKKSMHFWMYEGASM
jgi:hypothetical protein